MSGGTADRRVGNLALRGSRAALPAVHSAPHSSLLRFRFTHPPTHPLPMVRQASVRLYTYKHRVGKKNLAYATLLTHRTPDHYADSWKLRESARGPTRLPGPHYTLHIRSKSLSPGRCSMMHHADTVSSPRALTWIVTLIERGEYVTLMLGKEFRWLYARGGNFFFALLPPSILPARGRRRDKPFPGPLITYVGLVHGCTRTAELET